MSDACVEEPTGAGEPARAVGPAFQPVTFQPVRPVHRFIRAWLPSAARWVLAAGLLLAGCASTRETGSPSVATAWNDRHRAGATPPAAPSTSAPTGAAQAPPDGPSAAPPLARVNGHPIARDAFVNLLLRSHGPMLLEQFAVLQRAEALAAEKGLAVTGADVEAEFELALRRLADPLGAPLPLDRPAAEAVLDQVLIEHNLSREEFMLGMRRNACLRKIVETDLPITEEMLRTELAQVYGPRVQVRVIQLASLGDVARVQERLTAGASFEELARDFSAHAPSAAAGGLLPPVAQEDEEIPAALRQAAFAQSVGEVSAPIRVGRWHCLLRVERVLPPEEKELAHVRGELLERLRNRLSEPAMQKLYQRLLGEARIEIDDPGLRASYERRAAARGK
ncbi:MAG: peptidylprolyl isomerase [Planctomycetes bacterium]|nr:peptidylprolyl isomerase [Planctomycetota bacterium]